MSFVRETKVSKEEFYQMMADTREEYNILPVDECGNAGFGGGNVPSGITC